MILIGAVWYEYLFYNNLGIDIFSYISFSEIVSLFLGSIPILLLIGIVIALYIVFIILVFNKKIDRVINIKNLSPDEQKKMRSRNNAYSLLICFICLLLYIGPLMMPINKATTKFITSEGYFVLRIAVAFVFLSFAVIPYMGSKFEIKKLNLYGILFVIFFYCAIYYSASHKLWAMKNKPNYYFPTATIELKDNTTIYTNDSLIFVGKTHSYIFLYRFMAIADSSYTRIIPMDQTKNISIIKYGSWYRLP